MPADGLSVVYSCQVASPVAVSTWRPNPFAEVRYGEALHPGPEMDPCTIRICITNPTCVAKKAEVYSDLIKKFGIHVVTMSETAATAVAQKKFTYDMRASKSKMLWSQPVPPLSETRLGHATHRGKAAGVAIAATVPIRPSRVPLPEEWSTCNRILHAVVKMGQSHCQLVVLYCRPVCGQGAIDFNNRLLEAALHQVDQIPLPYIILGDMNMDVDAFEAWPFLASKGCRSLDQLHQRLHATCMPFTCKQATRPDNAIVSPALVPHVKSVSVLEATWFATHAPVLFQIDLPGHNLFSLHLRFPKSFVELCIDDQDWTDMTDQQCDLSSATTIEEWGRAVEKQVDATLRKGRGSVPRLSRAYRGRCQNVRFVKCPIGSPTKKAWLGSFEPTTEVVSMSTRRQVTQVRRIESLQQRLAKFARQGPTTPNTLTELQQEWKAILRSHCFGSMPFLHWICSWPEICWPAWPLPDAEWLYQVLQITRFQVEAALKRDEQIQKLKHAFHRQLDRSCNNKKAYATVRGPGLPRVSEIGRKVSFEAVVVNEDSSRHHRVYADQADIAMLSHDFPIAIGHIQAQVVEIECHSFTATTHEEVHLWEEDIPVIQHQFLISPGDIAKQLDAFWKPIWTRDEASMQFIDQTPAELGISALLEHLPPHPEIAIDMQCQTSWSHAVKRLKSGSARGTDLISAQEIKMLPIAFIMELARILAGYPKGFPESFMHGLVCPLSKTDDIPRADQTRPITLLPQIYRLWAAALTSQITKVLCAWIPCEVTGLLPSRGAASTAYRTQFVIEQARQANNQLSGITLDLIKCFNCIKWAFGFHAMASMGIPRNLLLMWIGSLQALTRHWLLSNQVLSAGAGTCGFPEGDQFSVLVMISLATAWVAHTRAAIPHAINSHLSAYADNWSWIHSEVTLHQPVLRTTLQITAAAGVAIDWNKTWCWTVCNRHASVIQQYVNQLVPGCHIEQKSAAADLGFQLQYSGNNTLGIAKTRIDKALLRLERLQAMPHQLSVKEAMLRTSVLPAALHGAEIKPPASDTLQQLRSKCAHALYGATTSLSPAIALVCSKGSILDPEYWLTAKAITTARAFLLQQSEDTRNKFFLLCSRFRGTLQHVHGPAAALSFLLCQLDWKLDAEGNMHVTAFMKLPLLGASAKRLLRFLEQAWMDRLILLHTARTRWYSYPDIARQETLAVLQRFSDNKRWLLVREIAGAFQTAQQKQKWLTTATGTCEFCQGDDSRCHRFMECPIGSHAREPFRQLLAELALEESMFPDHPVIMRQPDFEAMQLMLFLQPRPSWSEPLRQHVRQMLASGTIPHWYTDGSCMHPAMPHVRYAAFAVVLDLCQSDQERIDIACRYRGAPCKIPSFQVACVSRCQGEQDILRAELSAIVSLAEEIQHGVVHVDSQSAITLSLRALRSQSPAQFASCEHMDLLLRLWKVRHEVTLELVKVKSHQDPDQIEDPLLRYHAMGNNHVDSVANHACKTLQPQMVQQLDRMYHDTVHDQTRLEAVFELHVLLQEVRRNAAANNDDETKVPLHDHRALCVAFGNWTVSHSVFSFNEVDQTFLSSAAFGQEFAQMFVDWARQLVWPTDTTGPLGCTTGITWVELALSFMVYHQRYLPVLRKDERGVNRLVFPGSLESAKQHGLTYLESGTMLQKLLVNTAGLIPEAITPTGFQLQRRNAGCSNWKESRLGFSYEKDVRNCAAVCHATKRCVAFEIVTNASCRPMWNDQKGKGYCQLLSQKCQPMHLGMDCWDQYEMIDRGWHKAATFAVGIVPPVVLLLAYLVASCRSRKRRIAENGHLDSDSDGDSGSGSGSESGESGECGENHWEDPAWAAIAMQQLLDLHQKARQEFQDDFPTITMHHVNARILQPLCEKHGKCYAHIVNAEEPLLLNVFVSHAWQEGFDEFVQYVASPFRHWSLQPNLWICATALIQSRDASKVSAQVGVGEHPEAAPFTRALLRAGRLLVVRNQAVNLFERIWCCWELFKAYEIGLVATPGALMITGPADTNMAPVKIQQALASDPEDKKRIMRHIHQMARERNGPSLEQINQTLTHIKYVTWVGSDTTFWLSFIRATEGDPGGGLLDAVAKVACLTVRVWGEDLKRQGRLTLLHSAAFGGRDVDLWYRDLNHYDRLVPCPFDS
eukprot:s105_g48.t1